MHRKLGLAGIAGLFRTDAQARPLTRALTRAGLSFQKRSRDRVARRSRVAGIVGELRRMAGVTTLPRRWPRRCAPWPGSAGA